MFNPKQWTTRTNLHRYSFFVKKTLKSMTVQELDEAQRTLDELHTMVESEQLSRMKVDAHG